MKRSTIVPFRCVVGARFDESINAVCCVRCGAGCSRGTRHGCGPSHCAVAGLQGPVPLVVVEGPRNTHPEPDNDKKVGELGEPLVVPVEPPANAHGAQRRQRLGPVDAVAVHAHGLGVVPAFALRVVVGERQRRVLVPHAPVVVAEDGVGLVRDVVPAFAPVDDLRWPRAVLGVRVGLGPC